MFSFIHSLIFFPVYFILMCIQLCIVNARQTECSTNTHKHIQVKGIKENCFLLYFKAVFLTPH